MQEEIEALHVRVSMMWTPDADSFTGLGATDVDDGRFRATYERVASGLAEYSRDAMAHFATTHLR